jgi:hypothetical protein
MSNQCKNVSVELWQCKGCHSVCSICLENLFSKRLSDQIDVTFHTCEKAFHTSCLIRIENKLCPNCRGFLLAGSIAIDNKLPIYHLLLIQSVEIFFKKMNWISTQGPGLCQLCPKKCGMCYQNLATAMINDEIFVHDCGKLFHAMCMEKKSKQHGKRFCLNCGNCGDCDERRFISMNRILNEEDVLETTTYETTIEDPDSCAFPVSIETIINVQKQLSALIEMLNYARHNTISKKGKQAVLDVTNSRCLKIMKLILNGNKNVELTPIENFLQAKPKEIKEYLDVCIKIANEVEIQKKRKFKPKFNFKRFCLQKEEGDIWSDTDSDESDAEMTEISSDSSDETSMDEKEI